MRFLIFLLFSLVAFSTSAATLSQSNVQTWIDSHPEIQAWLDQHEELFPEEEQDEMNFNLEQIFAEGMQQLRDAGLYNEFNSKVQNAGFQGVEHWAETTQSITYAYMALAMEDNPQTRAMLEAQMQELRNTPHLPEDQKAMYEAMMQSALEMMDIAEEVPDADKETVRPYRQQLDGLFDMEPDF